MRFRDGNHDCKQFQDIAQSRADSIYSGWWTIFDIVQNSTLFAKKTLIKWMNCKRNRNNYNTQAVHNKIWRWYACNWYRMLKIPSVNGKRTMCFFFHMLHELSKFTDVISPMVLPHLLYPKKEWVFNFHIINATNSFAENPELADFSIPAVVVLSKKDKPNIYNDGFKYYRKNGRNPHHWRCTSSCTNNKQCTAFVETKMINDNFMMRFLNSNHTCKRSEAISRGG